MHMLHLFTFSTVSSSTLRKFAMIRSTIRKPFKLTAAVSQYLKPHLISSSTVTASGRYRPLTPLFRWFSTSDSPPTQFSELTRVATLVDGCDYHHWLVVMEPPNGYPQRHEIVHRYIETLAMALGSEEEAKRSIYSVSTKYYYAFGCKVSENLTHNIKYLPNVRWVLPDSYLCHLENSHGGEPFVDGEVAPYDEKYHENWLRDQNDDKGWKRTRPRKARRKEKNK